MQNKSFTLNCFFFSVNTFGMKYLSRLVSLFAIRATLRGIMFPILCISWITASVYGMFSLSDREGGLDEPITASTSAWTRSVHKQNKTSDCLLCRSGVPKHFSFNCMWVENTELIRRIIKTRKSLKWVQVVLSFRTERHCWSWADTEVTVNTLLVVC